MIIFGCRCFPYLRNNPNNNKFSRRSIVHRGYRCLDPTNHRVYISRHVVFDEVIFPFYKHTTNSSNKSTSPLVASDFVGTMDKEEYLPSEMLLEGNFNKSHTVDVKQPGCDKDSRTKKPCVCSDEQIDEATNTIIPTLELAAQSSRDNNSIEEENSSPATSIPSTEFPTLISNDSSQSEIHVDLNSLPDIDLQCVFVGPPSTSTNINNKVAHQPNHHDSTTH